MLITEPATLGKREFIHNYSDAKLMIKQDQSGELYEEAYDLPDAGYTYTETDEPIPEPEPEPSVEGDLT